MSLDSSIFLDYSCCVQEPQACFYGSYSQFSYFLNPHLAISEDVVTLKVSVSQRGWECGQSCGQSYVQVTGSHGRDSCAAGCSTASCGTGLLAFHQGPRGPAQISSLPLSLSLPPLFFISFIFFSFLFLPCCPALKQDCKIRMASWAGMLGNLCCTRQAD